MAVILARSCPHFPARQVLASALRSGCRWRCPSSGASGWRPTRRRPWGRRRRWCWRLPFWVRRHSVASAWAAKLMSMTLAGWPWAAARLIRRPSPRTYRRRPSGWTYSSTNSRTPLFSVLGLLGELVQGQLDVEVAGVADHRAILHGGEVLAADDVDVAGDGDEQVADLGGLGDRHDLEAVHRGLDGADRVDLGDDDVRRPCPWPAWRRPCRTSRSRRRRPCGRPAGCRWRGSTPSRVLWPVP